MFSEKSCPRLGAASCLLSVGSLSAASRRSRIGGSSIPKRKCQTRFIFAKQTGRKPPTAPNEGERQPGGGDGQIRRQQRPLAGNLDERPAADVHLFPREPLFFIYLIFSRF